MMITILSFGFKYGIPADSDMVMDFSEEFFNSLPFSPTGAQKRAVSEAIEDMKTQRPMNRLLQGDVGSGKTAIAACAA